MILTCPACSTRFAVNAAAFPADGRKVKCAKCGHVWHAAPKPAAAPVPPVVVANSGPAPEDDIQSIVPAVTVHPAPLRPETPPEMIWAGTDIPRRRPRRGAIYGIAAAVVAVTLGGLIVFRESVTKTVPIMGDVYAALGFQIDTTGLDLSIQAKSMEPSQADGVMTLVVTGTVANVTTEERPVPRIQAFLLGKDQKELHSWEFDAGVDHLKPGESHEFRQVLAKPPADTYQVYAHFAEAGE